MRQAPDGCVMHSRGLAAVGLVALVALAGCSVLSGGGTTSLDSSPATVSEGALSETGYEAVNVTNQTLSRSVSAAGQSREVAVTTHTAVYGRTIEATPGAESPAAGLVVLSVPGVAVGNRTVNPLSEISPSRVAERLASGYSGVEVGESLGNRSVRSLGAERTVTTFDGTATRDGTSLNLTVHATTFEHDGDFLVAVAVHPSRLPGESARVDTLLAGLEHEGEES